MVRDLYPSKENAEVLGSRLQQWNLLEPERTISSFRIRNQSLARYYASAENICYCKDIEGLMTELGCEHNPAHWWLFIDSKKTSLKTVLLHNRNIKPSIPVGYSILRKVTYNTIKILLDILEYFKYNWKICSDLKVLSLLLGLQLGYTKHMCFYVYGIVGKAAVTMQLKYGLLDKAPKLEDIMFITSLWLALQMLFTASSYQTWLNEKFCKSDGPLDQEGNISQRFLWSS